MLTVRKRDTIEMVKGQIQDQWQIEIDRVRFSIGAKET
jgi:hypothetical protein